MPQLDPVARTLLDKINNSRAPKLHELSVVEARQMYKRMAQRSTPPAEDIAAICNYVCPNNAEGVPVRLYVPACLIAAPGPAIVFVHGGGWVFGTIEDYDSFCCTLANRSECRVVSIGYRLAPEYPFPTALQDVERALRWILTEAATLSIDPTRLGVVADSAGANLAIVVAQSSQPPLPLPAFALVYPATDFTMSHSSYEQFSDGYLLTRATVQWFLRQYLPIAVAPSDPQVSPLYGPAILQLKHALIITAGFDPLRDEGHALAEKLRQEGVDVVYNCYADMIHGFITMGAIFNTADVALTGLAHWLKSKLK